MDPDAELSPSRCCLWSSPGTIPDQVLGPDRLGNACLGPDRSFPKGNLSVVRERLTDLLLHSQPVGTLPVWPGRGQGGAGHLGPLLLWGMGSCPHGLQHNGLQGSGQALGMQMKGNLGSAERQEH